MIFRLLKSGVAAQLNDSVFLLFTGKEVNYFSCQGCESEWQLLHHATSTASPFAFQHLISIFLWTGDAQKEGIAIHLSRGLLSVCGAAERMEGIVAYIVKNSPGFFLGFAHAGDGDLCCLRVVWKTSLSASSDRELDYDHRLHCAVEHRASAFGCDAQKELISQSFDFMEEIF